MTEASFASLGPTLLARKGGAKPAMRPQAAALPDEIARATSSAAGANADPLEDLGWNDMGSDHADDNKPEAKVVPISAKSGADEGRKAKRSKTAAPKPVAKPKKAKSKKSAKRAAFTLRLDADRHLKLRLASTMHDMSAQALVTRALDQMLDEIEDLDALVQRMKRN